MTGPTDASPTPDRSCLASARTVVVKVGTAALTGGTEELDRAFVHDLAAELAGLRASGRRVVLVSSGAVGAGIGPLGLERTPSDVTELQAAAAVGQPLLMSLWREALAVRGLPVAQVLVGRTDFDTRDRYLNIRNCLACLHERSVLPIVNENDTVATEEISLGDNDILAGKLAASVRADALVILTTVDGVLGPDGVVVSDAPDADGLLRLVRSEKSAQGRGGMRTKVEAARLAGLSGVPTVIASGGPTGTLTRVLASEPVGTFVPPAPARHAGRRVWIALTSTPAGMIQVDAGAARALVERGASLLARGVLNVTGRFGAGDVVAIHDDHGKEIARGLTNLTSDELRAVRGEPSSNFERLLGRRTHEEVVHRDNLAVTAAG